LPSNAPPEESESLLSAMRSLRVEHNPTRARAILEDYLARHPRSDLAEEALVMLIEAAVAHDDADAPTLAARYFSLYPKGEFSAQVRHVLSVQKGSAK
jgi:outer membrane protein assembly factor BamD (BamD/ComL family)